MWSSGNGYDEYALALTGATFVPLQGVFNLAVYIRPRYMKDIKSSVTSSAIVSMMSTISDRAMRRISRKSSMDVCFNNADASAAPISQMSTNKQ